MRQHYSIDEAFNYENWEKLKGTKLEGFNCHFSIWHTVTVLAKFHLNTCVDSENTCVDSENGKVNICIKQLGLGVLVFSDLNL